MKLKTNLLVLCLSFFSFINAQVYRPPSAFNKKSFNRISIAFSGGAHFAASPTNYPIKLNQLHHFSVNGRYMFTPLVGVGIVSSYDLFDGKGSANRNTNYYRTTVEGFLNLGNAFHLYRVHKNFGLMTHAGVGISNMWLRKEFRPTGTPTDPLFKGVDDMLNFTFGISPQWRISNVLALKMDGSLVFHYKQSNQFDMVQANGNGEFSGRFMNVSVGLNIYLGTKSIHADWIKSNRFKQR
jgi:OOP family OmpA-OmpF porin